MNIRKTGKARWESECEPCSVTVRAVDQLRITEARNAHLRSTQHSANVLQAAGRAAADGVYAFANAVVASFKPVLDFAEAMMATPPNRPHDPSLLSDKRKWGGK